MDQLYKFETHEGDTLTIAAGLIDEMFLRPWDDSFVLVPKATPAIEYKLVNSVTNFREMQRFIQSRYDWD